MGTLNSWAIVDANNNANPPDGWPENTMNYSDVNNTGRSVQGTMKRFFADINGSLNAGGAADAYTLSLNESGYAAYFDGMMFSCSIPADNLTNTPTMDVNGIGPVNIVDHNNNPVSPGELAAGGVHTFQHDGTNLRISGTGGVAGTSGQVQYNFSGTMGGASGMIYNNVSDELTLANPANFTVDLVLSEQADHTSSPGAGLGLIWLRDDGNLIYTNPSGVDTAIGTTGTSLPGGVNQDIQFNNAGAFDGSTDFTYDGTTVSILGTIYLENSGAAEGLNVYQSGTGQLAYLYSDVNRSNPMITIEHDNPSATGPALEIITDAPGANGLYVYSNVATRTAPLVFIENDLLTGNGVGMEIQNDPNGPHIVLSGQNGTGIEFPASQNASNDANTLDDYQEGEFTATFISSSGTITLNSAADTLAYVKIGRLVHLQGRLLVGSVSSPTGSVSLDGLPLALTPDTLTETADQPIGHVEISGLTAGAETPAYGLRFDPGDDTPFFTHDSGDSNIGGDVQAGSSFTICLTYLAAN